VRGPRPPAATAVSRPSDRDLTLALMRSTPRRLREMSRDCPPEQAAAPPAPGEWSIVEVVRHLVHGDRDTFLPRLRRMVAEPRPVFTRASRADGDAADLGTLLDAFQDARERALDVLVHLDEAGWRREGVSPSRGALTVEAYVATMADHDTEHLRQIHDVRETLGLPPKRCEARLALSMPGLGVALRATPERLAGEAAGLDAGALRHRPGEGEWSLKEVMAHLLHVETALFLPRLRRMATEERPVFEPFSPEPWARERDRREGSFAAELEAFRLARQATVDFLESLAPGAAERLGVSGVFGPMTLAQYATHIADHDLEHLAQMGASRRAATGARR